MDTTNSTNSADDPTVYTALGGEPFVNWPMQSPTSQLGINIRFYSIAEGEDIGARYRIDIGQHNEAMLERMYDDFELVKSGTSRKEFEEAIRGMFQARLAFINAYGLATTLYVAFTSDPAEMERLSRRERRVLTSQSRRFPYTAYEQYQHAPTTFWGHVKYVFGRLRAKLFR